jgi:hypothetical protein
MSRSIRTHAQYALEKKQFEDSFDANVPRRKAVAQVPPTVPPPQAPDNYSDRLTKYVPSEIVTLYLALLAATSQAIGDSATTEWMTEYLGKNWLFSLNVFAFVAGLVATPIYLRYQLNVRSYAHLLICAGSFIVWAVAIPDGLFKTWPPVVRGFLLPLYTFGVAFYEPNRPDNDPHQ